MRARQRSSGVPGNCSGSVGERGATTLAIQRSLSGARTMGQSVCRALTADFTATHNIQGAFPLYNGPVGDKVPTPTRALRYERRDSMTDRIANPWGTRTPFGRGEEWPVRVDQFLEEGIS